MKETMRKISVIVSIAVGAALLALFVWMWGPQFAKTVLVSWRTFMSLVLLVVVGLGVVGILSYRAYALDESYSASKSSLPLKLGAGVVGVLTLAMAVTFFVRVGYDSERHYAGSINVVEDETPSFGSRAPYDVAVASSNNNMGDITGTSVGVKAVADLGDDGQWNSMIERRGVGRGYEAIQTINAPLFGSVSNSDVSFCEFDESANLRFNGFFPKNNLNRALDWQIPFDVLYDTGDAYGYCEDGTPYVVIPLKETHGFYGAWQTPYGLALYNGKTGDINVTTDEKVINSTPGSTYPISLVSAQRASSTSSGTLGDRLWGATGYLPGGDGNTEIQLGLADSGDATYVTPLSPNGDSNSIIGLGVSEAGSFTPGKLNDYTVYKYKDNESRQAISAVTREIKTKYSGLTDWASGIDIFEIVPAEDGTWVASIGQNQSIKFRASIDEEKNIVLMDKDGNIISPEGAVSSTDGGTTDLGSLTPQQLTELVRNAMDELDKRGE
jgi:hypothetical protein